MNEKKQHREVGFEVKSMDTQKTDSGEFAYFSGYASTFGNMDSYSDVILPGAFSASLKENSNIRMLWQHEWSYPIGSFTKMQEDTNGLMAEGRINLGTEKGREAYALLKARDVNSMSIGYFTKKCQYDEEKDIRYLLEVELIETSIVTVPANRNALITDVKSALRDCKTVRDTEKFLQDVGLSRKESQQLISVIKGLPSSRDASEVGDKSGNASRDAVSDADLQAFMEEIKAFKNKL